MQVSPLAHPSPSRVRVTSTKTVPTFVVRGAAALRLAFFFLAFFFLAVCARFFFSCLALCFLALCLVAFFLAAGTGTSRSPTVTDEFTPPPKGTFAFHTS